MVKLATRHLLSLQPLLVIALSRQRSRRRSSSLILLTRFMAWLIGYYYEPCPVCHRYFAILNNGQFVFFCSKKKHDLAAPSAHPPQEAK